MKRKNLTVTFALLLMMLLLPLSVLGAESRPARRYPYAVEGGNIYFNKVSGEIIESDRNIKSAVIPRSIDGVAVTSIAIMLLKKDTAFRM